VYVVHRPRDANAIVAVALLSSGYISNQALASSRETSEQVGFNFYLFKFCCGIAFLYIHQIDPGWELITSNLGSLVHFFFSLGFLFGSLWKIFKTGIMQLTGWS